MPRPNGSVSRDPDDQIGVRRVRGVVLRAVEQDEAVVDERPARAGRPCRTRRQSPGERRVALRGAAGRREDRLGRRTRASSGRSSVVSRTRRRGQRERHSESIHARTLHQCRRAIKRTFALACTASLPRGLAGLLRRASARAAQRRAGAARRRCMMRAAAVGRRTRRDSGGGGSARYATASRCSARSTRRTPSQSPIEHDLVVDHAARQRDAAHDIFGDVGSRGAPSATRPRSRRPGAGARRCRQTGARGRRRDRRTARPRRPEAASDRARCAHPRRPGRRSKAPGALSRHTLCPALIPSFFGSGVPV